MRHEELTVGALTVDTLKNESGASLLTSNVLASGKVFIGSAGNVAEAKTIADLNALLGPYSIVYAGASVAENDADASVAVTVEGVAATDIAFAVMIAGATPQAVKLVACTLNTVTVTLAGNGGAGTQVAYVVLRATT